MDNLAQDFPAWIVVAKSLVLLIALWWIFSDFFRVVNKLQKPNSKFEELINAGFKRRMVIKSCVFVALFLALFMFFGPGRPTVVTPAEEDGHRKMVESRPEPPAESQIIEEAKGKVDPYLKAVEATPEAARKQSQDYVDEIIKRNEKGK